MALRMLRTTITFQTRNTIKLYLNTNVELKTRFQSTSTLTKTKFTGTRTWRGIVKGFVPVGLCLLAVMQWRAYRRYSADKIASHWEVNLYCSLPLRSFSRGWGWIAERHVPETLRPWVYGLYSSMFSVNLNEAASSDLKAYTSLAEFFARPLKHGMRPVDGDSCLTAPCDGTVLHFGAVNTCRVEQVKGVTYSLEEFMTGERDKGGAQGEEYRRSLVRGHDTRLYQCVLYLAPGDYHRFHSPADWRPECRRHFAGELLSVSPGIARWIPGLFVLNERAVYTGSWEHGFFSFTPVGATNVGSMRVYFDRGLHTNVRRPDKSRDCTRPIRDVRLHKGDMIGEFRMGSTIVLIFEAPNDFQFNLSVGEQVRVGQAIGRHHNTTNTHVQNITDHNSRVTTTAA